MTAVFCVDDSGGLGFNGRRQSRDRVLTKRLLELADVHALTVSPYTASLFSSAEDAARIRVCESCYANASAEDICFAEDEEPDLESADRVILFRWNRLYPSDRRFDLSRLGSWTLVSSEEFEGSSHKRITMEVYTK